MKRILGIGLAALMLVGILGGCAAGTSDTAPTTVKIYGVNGPTGVGLVQLRAAAEKKTLAYDATVRFVTAPEEIIAKITTGDADIAAVPTNLAANLYQKKGGGVRMLALNTGCVLSLMENGDTVQTIQDLRGKTVYLTGRGSNPEYILRHLLEKSGLQVGVDVTLEFMADNQELLQALVSRKIQIALMPEPMATVALVQSDAIFAPSDLRRLPLVDETWRALENDTTPMMGCLIVRNEFLEQHRDIVDAFLQDYATSVAQATEQLDATAALCKQYGVIASETLAKRAIPECALVCITGKEMRPAVEPYFEILFESAPQSLGGAVPDGEFYYEG